MNDERLGTGQIPQERLTWRDADGANVVMPQQEVERGRPFRCACTKQCSDCSEEPRGQWVWHEGRWVKRPGQLRLTLGSAAKVRCFDAHRGARIGEAMNPGPSPRMIPTRLLTASTGLILNCSGRWRTGPSLTQGEVRSGARWQGRRRRRSLRNRPCGRRPGYRVKSRACADMVSRQSTLGARPLSPSFGFPCQPIATACCCRHWCGRRLTCARPAGWLPSGKGKACNSPVTSSLGSMGGMAWGNTTRSR